MMTYHEAAIYMHHGWTVTRLAWGNPDHYLRKVGEGKSAVFKASSMDMRLTPDDFASDDWVKIAQFS